MTPGTTVTTGSPLRGAARATSRARTFVRW